MGTVTTFVLKDGIVFGASTESANGLEPSVTIEFTYDPATGVYTILDEIVWPLDNGFAVGVG